MINEPDPHAYQPGLPCLAEWLHEGAHTCDTEGCELRQIEHPADE